jgi:hypothetical protein
VCVDEASRFGMSPPSALSSFEDGSWRRPAQPEARPSRLTQADRPLRLPPAVVLSPTPRPSGSFPSRYPELRISALERHKQRRQHSNRITAISPEQVSRLARIRLLLLAVRREVARIE